MDFLIDHRQTASRVAPYPSPPDEAERLAALVSLRILDTTSERAFDDLVTLASAICGTPIALVSLVDQDRQWFKAEVGLGLSETPRDASFCTHAIVEPTQVFSIDDATADARFVDNPLVTGEPHIRFYAGAPIVTDDGHALGTVCVIDTKPRVLTESQSQCLRVIARQASGLMALRKQSIAAAELVKSHAHVTLEARLKQEKGAELLDLVLQGRALGLWDLDVASGRWKASSHELEMLGYGGADAEIPDSDWTELVHPDDLPLTRTSMEPHLRGEAPFYECTIRMWHRKGRWIWVLSRAVVVERAADGGPLRIVGTHEDVTESRRLERERRQNAERVELAMSGGNLGLWDLNVATGHVIYNAQWAEMLGYTLPEVESRPEFWKEVLHPDESDAFADALQSHLRGDAPMLEIEGRLRHKRGDWVWVITRARVLERDALGYATRLVGIVVNITSRKQSEVALVTEFARRKALLNQATEFVFVLDQGMRLKEANPSFIGALGFSAEELMHLRPWQWDALTPTREQFQQRWSDRTSAAWTAETQWRRKDGSVFDVSISCTTVSFDGERELLFVCHDITESKRTRAAMERARLLLEETGRLARVGGWELDIRTSRITWTEQVHHIHEVGLDYVPGLDDALDFYAAEARPVLSAAVEQAIAHGTPYDLELPFITANGRHLWVRAIGRAEHDDGQVVRLVGAFQDITDRRQAEQALIRGEHRLRMITDHTPALIAYIDSGERYAFVNAHFGRVFGIDPQSIVGRKMQEVCSAGVYDDIALHVRKALSGEPTEFEASGPARGELMHYQSHYVPDIGSDGVVAGFYALIFDVTARKKAELKSAENERRLRGIADNVPALISEVGPDGRFTFANATYRQWLGVDHHAMIGKDLRSGLGDRYYTDRAQEMQRALDGEVVSFDRQVDLPAGERTLHSTYVPHFDDAGRVAGFYALTNDITELKRTQMHLDALARADALTGLPNRRHLEEHAAEALARARRSAQPGVLFYLDVDHFKTINDTLGHAIGDEVLQEFGRRLRDCLRETDFVARYAGDEFVALAEGVGCEEDMLRLAGKIVEAVRGSFTLSLACMHVTTSVGVAAFDGHQTWKSLLARADSALYAAKERGRDGFALAPAIEPSEEDRTTSDPSSPERLDSQQTPPVEHRSTTLTAAAI